MYPDENQRRNEVPREDRRDPCSWKGMRRWEIDHVIFLSVYFLRRSRFGEVVDSEGDFDGLARVPQSCRQSVLLDAIAWDTLTAASSRLCLRDLQSSPDAMELHWRHQDDPAGDRPCPSDHYRYP